MDYTTQKPKLRNAAIAAWIACAIALLSVLALTSGASASTRARAAGESCGRIDFAPQSENLAFNIRTYGVSCSAGRAVADASRSSSLRPAGEHTYQARGFLCHGRFVQPMGKGYERYVCARGSDRVVFDRG